MKFIVTGGAGFIGSALIRYLAKDLGHAVLNIDKLSYAANLESLTAVSGLSNYTFSQTDILDSVALEALFSQFQPDGVFHLAAETHVDRSIANPGIFVENNVLGTQRLLSATCQYLETVANTEAFRFLHVSTDEVFGELPPASSVQFTESTHYDPRSPYAASKAGADHLVRAFANTYGLPTLITNCSNNYGPYQNPEKLIPMILSNALKHKRLPVYGKGKQIRDWLFVGDHVRGLYDVICKGRLGQSYNIGGHNEKRNIDVVTTICALLDKKRPLGHDAPVKAYAELIEFVADRPGHDFRYAIDASKIQQELDWVPLESFNSGLEKTVNWYLENWE